jgi:hypothetical protein
VVFINVVTIAAQPDIRRPVNSQYYPFKLDGGLCPLLNDGELLLGFYEEESLRHGIKQFCKRAAWPGKPAATFAVDAEKLKELVVSLFNSPVARKMLATSRCPYLYDAMWEWLTLANSELCDRIKGCCEEIKGKLFLKVESWATLLAALRNENPPANTVLHLAYVMLAFAMLQEDDRFVLGEALISTFPEYAEKLYGL